MSLKIAVIIASNRPNRAGKAVGDWALAQLIKIGGADYDLIDLAEENLPFLAEPMPPSVGNYQNQSTKKWAEKIADYDGFVFVTPEYNHGYSAVLKNALDTIYEEWAKKPVAFVGYGALGAVAAIEQLVNVTAQLNMVPHQSTAVKVLEIWSAQDEDGTIKPQNFRGDYAKLSENLLWWANLLQQARKK